jgi:segregation and condensation protein A
MTDIALDLEHPSPEGKPLARVYGEAFNDLPFDLYIPPDALEVFLDSFEGPLDLLLYLIRRQNINVLDIPMAELTRQYLGYVEMMRRTQLELAAEYLLMAAVLIEIKSRLLLPKPPAVAGGEAEDPRAELVRRLLEYERMKQAARAIDELPLADRDFATVRIWFDHSVAARLPDVSPDDLKAAWAVLIARAHVNRHHLVSREQLSVRSEMSRILKLLAPSRFAEFTALFAEHADIPASCRDVPGHARTRAGAAGECCAGGALRADLRTTEGRTGICAGCRRMNDEQDLSGNDSPGTLLPDQIAEIKGILEAALLVAGEPVPLGQLAKLFDPPLTPDTVRKLLDDLKSDWSGRKVELTQVASGWRFQGSTSVQTYLDRLSPEKPPRYSRAVMETLAIIAYQQPVTRGDIEAIRGVAVSTNVIKTLEDRQWVEAVGHRETPGRPALFATTKAFLDDLGLRSLAELPPLAELDSSHLLEMPDAPTKAAETAFAHASPLLGNDAAAEPGADSDSREPPAGETQTLH